MQIKLKKSKPLLDAVRAVSEKLAVEAYVVGGFVRDLLLKTEGNDLDFVVVGDALQFAEEFRRQHSAGKLVSFPRFGTAMLHYRNYKLEFVSARSEHYDAGTRKPAVQQASLHSDLSRRDFTINCLAMDIGVEQFGEIIDLYNGVEDIRNKLIRTPLDPVVTFSDDPLRILRAIRFATVLKFKLDKAAHRAILATRDRLAIISQERITEEFSKMMLADRPSLGLYLMKELQLFPVIFPELEALSGVEQRRDQHHKDVFDHTLKVIDNISRTTDKLDLRLAALFHDIAKPQTKRFVEEIGWTFHGHEDLGARMVNRIGRRMRLPLSDIKYIQNLVRLHLRPMQLVEENVTDSAIRRLMVEAGEQIDDLMKLCRADITSKNPGKVKRYLANFDRVEAKMRAVEEKDRLRTFKVAIDGNRIMEALGIAAGPLVGQIKQAITDAVLDGQIANDAGACFDYMMKIKDRFLSIEEAPKSSRLNGKIKLN